MADGHFHVPEVVGLEDSFRPEMERIKRELSKLQSCTIHVGVLGEGKEKKHDDHSDVSMLTIARVHEYGATIHAKNVQNLAIPLSAKAKKAKSPREFHDLVFIKGESGIGYLVRDKEHGHGAPKPRKPKSQEPKKHNRPDPDKKNDFDSDQYEWMYMLLPSVEIPERSFIRASYDTGKSKLEQVCKEAVDNIIRKGWTAEDAVKMIGSWAANMTRQYMNTSLSPPKSAITRRTNNVEQPLYETGKLLGLITYKPEWGNNS